MNDLVDDITGPTPTIQSMQSYLLSHGWAHQGNDHFWASYSKALPGGIAEIEAPLVSTASDFRRAVDAFAKNLEVIERRRFRDIWRELSVTDVDRLSIRLAGNGLRDGRISIEAGRALFQAARDLTLAAACSALDPRSVFAKRKPAEAMKFLDTAKFGQTEIGSFIINIESNVPPKLQLDLLPEDPDQASPFSRRVMEMLASGISGAQDAATDALVGQKLSAFTERRAIGVSANLCEAIALMIDCSGADIVSTRVSFASHHPPSRALPLEAHFSTQLGQTLATAGAKLRETSDTPDVELTGLVRVLASKDTLFGGDVTIEATIDGRQKHVVVRLSSTDHNEAIRAYENRLMVSFEGTLRRSGNSQIVEELRGFKVLEVSAALS